MGTGDRFGRGDLGSSTSSTRLLGVVWSRDRGGNGGAGVGGASTSSSDGASFRSSTARSSSSNRSLLSATVSSCFASTASFLDVCRFLYRTPTRINSKAAQTGKMISRSFSHPSGFVFLFFDEPPLVGVSEQSSKQSAVTVRFSNNCTPSRATPSSLSEEAAASRALSKAPAGANAASSASASTIWSAVALFSMRADATFTSAGAVAASNCAS
mmetsp:Transcript_8691/g.23574  ORF Transcript_8691/g.23574 Transcript_8691/m.23574 type:complete len:213 (-) Transcript_8691:3456-4094(-)